jgi:CubicO group peptidase (beta-lactamase class C family)
MKKLFSLLLLLFCLGSAIAQTEKYNEIIDRNFKPNEPGGTVLIAKAGKVIYQRGFGMASLELGVAMKPEMIFLIGSMTKQFTAVCILQLMEQGKLELKNPVSRYIAGLPEAWSGISLEHLLTHTSGIPELPIDQATSLKDISVLAASKPLMFPTGTKRVYCNTGFALLGHVIEKVSGITYQDYLQQRIILPLGMEQTYYNSGNRIYPGLVPAYVKKREFMNFRGNIPPSGAGALLSGTSDMLKWYSGLAAGKVLKKETLTLAWTSHVLTTGERIRNGYGWNTGGRIQGSGFVEHGGISGGHLADAMYFPKEELLVVVFTNQRGLSPEVVTTALAAEALGRPDTIKAVSLSVAQLLEYQGVYAEAGDAQKLISASADGLSYQRADGGPKLKMVPYGKDRFFFEGTVTLAKAERDSAGRVVSITLFDKRYSEEPGSVLKRTDLPLPGH